MSYRINRLSSIISCILFFFGTGYKSALHANPAVVDGELLLLYIDGTTQQQISDFEVAHGLSLVRYHDSIGVYHYSFQDDLWLKISQVRASEIVYFAEPNYLRKRQSMPNDPFYKDQWYLPQIRWDTARDEFTGSAPVTVAVIDSGVSKAHSHLLGYLLQQGEWDFANDDADANDESGHGTMVAGIITGNTNEGFGVAGICENVRILPLRVFDNAGFIAEGSVVDTSVLMKALHKARSAGAKVVNLSLGSAAYSYFESLAVDKCQAAGMLLVCAAGNGGNDGFGDNNDWAPTYPASYASECIISVAATDENDDLAAFSNFGIQTVDIAAPGQNIFGCDVPRKPLLYWDFQLGWQNWVQNVTYGYGLVWNWYLGRFRLATSDYLGFPGFYAPYSRMSLISPTIDLSEQKGARLELRTGGILGIDDLLTLWTRENNETIEKFNSVLLYPGWQYGTLQRDISHLDGSKGELRIKIGADLSGLGAFSGGSLLIDEAVITVLDQRSWAVDAMHAQHGTSFSAPIVSGVAAALFSQAPNLTAAQVKNLILTTARPVAGLNGKLLYPAVVDYAAALRAAKALSTSTEQTPPLEFLDEIIGTWKGAQTVYVGGTKVINPAS